MGCKEIYVIALTVISINVACLVDDPNVDTMQGAVRGRREIVYDKPVEVYLGIPYARPPVGVLRFDKPVPMDPWEELLNATSMKASCIQTLYPGKFEILTQTSEDCLYLNVWTPSRETPLKTVLVWIHGGAYSFGSSYQAWYNGSVLSSFSDVVVVTMNYRVGMFGFFDAGVPGAPGNVGHHDQLLALKWVQKNIEKFGGNPNKVTIFGESSGAYSVHLHMISPLSKGLFHRVFFMSGTYLTNTFHDTREESVHLGNKVAEALSCSEPAKNLTTHPDEVLQCLKSKSATTLLEAATKVTNHSLISFLPTFGNEFMSLTPVKAMEEEQIINIDVLLSVTADEGPFAIIMQPDPRLSEEELTSFNVTTLRTHLEGILGFIAREKYESIGKEYLDRALPGDKQSLRQKYVDFVSDIYFVCPSKFFTEKYSAGGNKVYSIVFGHRSKTSPLPKWAGVMHTSDIGYYFGVPFMDTVNYTQEDRDFSREVMKTFVSYAKEGKPTLSADMQWPPFTQDNQVSIWFQPNNYSQINTFYKNRCDLWTGFP